MFEEKNTLKNIFLKNTLLKNTLLKRFHLAVSSHLMRARDTALAILEHDKSVELEQWKVVKERCFGHLMEGNLNLIKPQVLWPPDGGQP